MAILKRTNRFPSFFDDDFFSNDLMDWASSNYADFNSTLPAVNVKESDNDYTIEVAAPGVSKENFKINVENNRLVISCESKNKSEDVDENKKFTRREFSYQSFQRAFSLPETQVDSEKIRANYKDGILIVTLPKKEEVKPKPLKEIKIE